MSLRPNQKPETDARDQLNLPATQTSSRAVASQSRAGKRIWVCREARVASARAICHRGRGSSGTQRLFRPWATHGAPGPRGGQPRAPVPRASRASAASRRLRKLWASKAGRAPANVDALRPPGQSTDAHGWLPARPIRGKRRWQRWRGPYAGRGRLTIAECGHRRRRTARRRGCQEHAWPQESCNTVV